MSKKRHLSIERRNSRNGFLFTLPWLIGVLLFFISPLIQSIAMSFSDVAVTLDGFKLTFAGFKNYYYILYQSPEYLNNLMDSINEFLYEVPIILILSLIIAVVLNSKFRGRTFFRSLFFVPVILVGSVVMTTFLDGGKSEAVTEATQSVYLSGLIDFKAIFAQMGITGEVTDIIFHYIDEIFDLIWLSGVQIILFISGLQSIPDQLYEVSKVEGASKWEEFWYITVPMLGNSIVLVLIYTVIDFCVSSSNAVIQQAYTVLLDQQVYGTSSAMLWLFFAVIGAMLSVVFFLYYRFCLKKWQ